MAATASCALLSVTDSSDTLAGTSMTRERSLCARTARHVSQASTEVQEHAKVHRVGVWHGGVPPRREALSKIVSVQTLQRRHY